MSIPPPAPHVSDDGKFWWDGERWNPMPTAGLPAPPVQAARHGARRGCIITALVVLVAFAGVVLLAGLTGHSGPLGNHTVKGTIVLVGEHSSSGGHCSGTGGYGDMTGGAPVTVKHEKGTLLATGSLNDGVISGATCSFSFSVSNVPDNASFYQIEVSHRGALSYSHDDLKARNWTLSLTLGQ